MKKGFFKSFAAVVMALTMAFSLTTIVGATETDYNGTVLPGYITGVGSQAETAIIVRLPADVNFAIDPAGISESQIKLYNRTDASVLVSLNVDVQVGDGIDLLKNVASLGNAGVGNSYNPTGVSTPGATQIKGVVFGILSANKATTGETNPTDEINPVNFASQAEFDFPATIGGAITGKFFRVATPSAIASSTVRASKGQIAADFVLGPAGPTASIGGVAGIMSFKLTGEYTLGDNWDNADMSVKTYYTMAVIGPAIAAKLRAEDKVDDSINMITLTAAERPTPHNSTNVPDTVDVGSGGGGGAQGFTSGGNPTSYAVSYSKAAAANVVVGFNFNGATVTSITLNGTTWAGAGTDYSVSNSAITILGTAGKRLNGISNGAKSFTITLSDNTAYTLTVTVGA